MNRRALLTALGGVTLSLSGCTGGTEPSGTGGGLGDGTEPRGTDDTGERTDVPAGCPRSQDLDVEWPEDLDAATVEAFVEAYEREYFREVVVAYEPRSRLDSYELSGRVSDPPSEVGDGWKLEYEGGGGVYRPTLMMGATTAAPPEGADVVSVDEIEDDPLTRFLEEAAETGEAEFHVEPPGPEVDRYVDLLASLSDDFERLSGRGESDTAYVEVGDATVELSVTASTFHGDYFWRASYYVDERVVWRATDDADPRDGELLECREPG